MMKKNILCTFLLLTNLLISPVFAAASDCLNKMSQRDSEDFLWLNNCQLHDEDMAQVADYINQHPTITYLFISNNPLTGKGVATVADNQQIKNLYASNIPLGDEGAITLAKTLNQHNTLTFLSIDNDGIGKDGALALASNPALQTITLSENPAVDLDVITALAKKENIVGLTFGGRHFSTQEIAVLAKSATLLTLGLANVGIDEEGVTLLAKNPVLQVLYLDDPISQVGIAALAKNTSLKGLYLYGNAIGDQGAATLAKNTTLEFLILAGNQITSVGAAAFANNTSLLYLQLDNNTIDDAGAIELAKNTKLTSLLLTYNNIHDAGAIALAKNTTLHFLDVRENPIGKAGLAALADSSIQDVLYDSLLRARLKKHGGGKQDLFYLNSIRLMK